MEIVHQLKLRREVPFIRPEAAMSKTEFEKAIANGRKLVLLDELVLDITKFIDQHPGGRFVLNHNIGRDVSKFFYGGYSLEGNIGVRNPARGYAHSTFARKVVNDLAIAHYQKSYDLSSVICRVNEAECETVSPSTKTIVLENVSGEPVPGWKKFYNSSDFFAKHFLIRDMNGAKNSIFRHYTTCNAMQPNVYNGFINALKADNEPGYMPF